MRLLLDEDSGLYSLLKSLCAHGHDVGRVVDVPALGAAASDDAIFAFAIADDRVLLTKNGADFAAIVHGRRNPTHPGVLVLHYGRNGSNLPVRKMVQAVANIFITYETTRDLFLDVTQHVW